MRILLLASVFLSMAVAPLSAQDYGGKADLDSNFRSATKLAPDGSEAAKGTDIMLRDTTTALHNEHMAILDELARIEKQIADLKKDVKTIKGQVE